MRRDRATGRRGRRPAAIWRYALTAVLGLPGRRPRQVPAARAQRDASTSSYEQSVGAENELQFGRAYWLPPFGEGNGLEALFWAPVAELPEERVATVLAALREAGIPAWAARARRDRPVGSPAADRSHDLWVASIQVDEAQDVVMRSIAG
jgi:hypothetical protein